MQPSQNFLALLIQKAMLIQQTMPYNITIPDKLGGCPVTGLGEYSFSGYLSAAQSNEPYQFGRNIHSVTIPQSVTSIGDYAFHIAKKWTLLLSMTLPHQ